MATGRAEEWEYVVSLGHATSEVGTDVEELCCELSGWLDESEQKVPVGAEWKLERRRAPGPWERIAWEPVPPTPEEPKTIEHHAFVGPGFPAHAEATANTLCIECPECGTEWGWCEDRRGTGNYDRLVAEAKAHNAQQARTPED